MNKSGGRGKRDDDGERETEASKRGSRGEMASWEKRCLEFCIVIPKSFL